MDAVRRQAARYRVHISVRYEAAADFVREYAENLSRGGLFIRGGQGLQRRRDLEVDVELPGLGVYRVRAEVMHVIGAEEAARHGRTVGAGLSIVEAPPGFEAALARYLGRLGQRADAMVLCAGDEAARLLAAAGYQIGRCGAADELATRLREDGPVLAVVAPGAEVAALRAAAPEMTVVAMDGARELDRVLGALDAHLPAPSPTVV